MSHIKFVSDDNRISFFLPVSLFETISQKSICSSPQETGGIIIGNYVQNDDNSLNTAIATDIVCSEQNKSFLNRFLRNGKKLTKILSSIWLKSNGKTYYIGEWHSHPRGAPCPSFTDSNSMKAISNTPEEECRSPILIIIGNKMRDYTTDLAVFVYHARNKHELKYSGKE